MLEDKKIYYLSLEKNRPNWFYQMAKGFNNQGVKLVPLNANQLQEFCESEPIHVVISTSDLGSRRYFEKLGHEFLGFAIRTRSVFIHHLSSFDPPPDYLDPFFRGYYTFYRLPFHLNHFINRVCDRYNTVVEKDKKWPGGNRPKFSGI